MSRLMIGSGKFEVQGTSNPVYLGDVPSKPAVMPVEDNGGQEVPEKKSPESVEEVRAPEQECEAPVKETVKIPPVPENPDRRPVLIQYMESWFGKYWLVTLLVILYLLLRKK